VSFLFGGPQGLGDFLRGENSPDFTSFGDSNGNYFSGPPLVDGQTYMLTGNGYSEPRVHGNYGPARTIQFTVDEDCAICPSGVCIPGVKITATSADHGLLGYFVVDVSVLEGDTSLVASQFADFYFADPLGVAVVTPANVPADTGRTLFDNSGGIWTVVNGSGDSLTTNDGYQVWIVGTDTVEFQWGSDYPTIDSINDVTWSTVSV
jgi:hypothetical protein